jgi:signal transduction histidine kinase
MKIRERNFLLGLILVLDVLTVAALVLLGKSWAPLLVMPVVLSIVEPGCLITVVSTVAALLLTAWCGGGAPTLVAVAVIGNAVLAQKALVTQHEEERRNIEDTLRRDAAELEHLWNEQTRLSSELAESLNELAAAKRETEEALNRCKIAQASMVQSEKMASIGVLAAGIAHEINNPVSFVSSNLRELGSYVIKIRQYLLAAEELEAVIVERDWDNVDRVGKELAHQRQLLKLNIILDDLNDLVRDSLDGTSSIEAIVRSLKLYARKDGESAEAVDIVQAMENSLRIVWNQLKYNAIIVKDYHTVLPVMGHHSQLQQVFSNLLVNAGQAQRERGQIRLQVVMEGNEVVIRISDQGSGIAPDILNRIFEPFFTTKEVGRGTGLGLSIAYDIVSRHGGTIAAESEIGKGTTMTVRLPVAVSKESISVEN